MEEPILAQRVEVLETRVALLGTLPERVSAVESQIVQLRNEMRSEFSAVRQEMREGRESLRQEMRALNEDTQNQMRLLHEDVIDRIAKIGEAKRARKRRP